MKPMELDKRWFQRHPGRTFRLRPPHPTDEAPFLPDAPASWARWIVVTVLGPGLRSRIGVAVPPDRVVNRNDEDDLARLAMIGMQQAQGTIITVGGAR